MTPKGLSALFGSFGGGGGLGGQGQQQKRRRGGVDDVFAGFCVEEEIMEIIKIQINNKRAAVD